MKIAVLRHLAIAAGVAALLGTTAMAEEPVRGGTLITTLAQTPRHLNPAVQSGIVTGAPARNFLRRRCVMTRIGRRSLTLPKAGHGPMTGCR